MMAAVTAKVADALTAKVAAMSVDECASRAEEIVTTPGSGDNPALKAIQPSDNFAGNYKVIHARLRTNYVQYCNTRTMTLSE